MAVSTYLSWLYISKGIYFILCILPMIVGSDEKHCDRINSRHVQKVIATDILPAYEQIQAKIPPGCPFDMRLSVYAGQEEKKYREHANKWVCHQCGKSFYEERYIDLHMDNRHSFLKRTGASVVCLADLCDVFRCEVLSTEAKPSYWARALCDEHKLGHRRDSCQELIKQCVPAYLQDSEKKILTEALNNGLCKFLNCNTFWEVPQKQINPINTALYVMAFMMLSVGLFIYYYVAYTHFYTDDSILEQLRSDERHSNRHVKYPPVPSRDYLRYRPPRR